MNRSRGTDWRRQPIPGRNRHVPRRFAGFALMLGAAALSVPALAGAATAGDLITLTSAIGPDASPATINPVTGVVTPLGSATLPDYGIAAGAQFTSLISDGTHAYFAGTSAVAGRTNTFYSLDLTSGALSHIIDVPPVPDTGFIDGLGWDPLHHQLLALTSGAAPDASIADIDPVTGVVTPLGSATLPDYGIALGAQFTSLFSDGTHAYFAGASGVATRTNTFYSLDLASGALSKIIDVPAVPDTGFIDALGVIPSLSSRPPGVPETGATAGYVVAGMLLLASGPRWRRRLAETGGSLPASTRT